MDSQAAKDPSALFGPLSAVRFKIVRAVPERGNILAPPRGSAPRKVL